MTRRGSFHFVPSSSSDRPPRAGARISRASLAEGDGCALSPDGRWALAIHFGPPHRLLLLPTGFGETASLAPGPVETCQTANFLPDGRRIVFVGAERGRPQRTWLQELPKGLPTAVTPEGTVGVTTSPDGRWVAAISRSCSSRCRAESLGLWRGSPQRSDQPVERGRPDAVHARRAPCPRRPVASRSLRRRG